MINCDYANWPTDVVLIEKKNALLQFFFFTKKNKKNEPGEIPKVENREKEHIFNIILNLKKIQIKTKRRSVNWVPFWDSMDFV